MTREPWRVGVLFSRSGVMEVVESELFRGTALAVEEINRSGGVLGREIEPVCHDPGSDPAAYRTLADRLMIEAGVGTIFGCLTSACRKALLPSLERRNGLLWYAANYEGFEYSPNIIYTGAAPNQSTLQLASYILRERGNRIALVGSDYVFPRETNRIIRDLVEQEGGDIVAETYVPIAPGAADLQRAIGQIRSVRPEVIVCTIIGRGVREFYRACSEDGGLRGIPIGSLSLAETELAMIGPSRCVGHFSSAAYFPSVDTPASRRFVDAFAARFGGEMRASVYSEGAYSQVFLFAAALEQAGQIDAELLSVCAGQTEIAAPRGPLVIDADNNHAWVRPRIGVVNQDGHFDIAWEADAAIKPDPYLIHPFLHGSGA
ncbi:MAG: transporter substrate-binding domain-containing protein [Acetobacteraceae bacterium]|nr:transporter substrate-binding domain-containing protein [Acetobacteraceae bacterium]